VASEERPGQERSEQPTPRRREEARRKGQVAVSTDLTAAAVLLGALGVHTFAGVRFLEEAVDVFVERLGTLPSGDFTPDAARTLLWEAALTGAWLGWPFVVIPGAVGVAAQLMQTRFVTAPLKARWERVNPLEGLRRLLGPRGLVQLAKSVVKLVLVGGIALLTLRTGWPRLMAPGAAGESALGTVGGVVADLWLRVGLAYLAVAALDYGYQWWRHERGLRMTREEVRKELKETEGDPLLRSRFRSLHRELTKRRMIAEVKRATVVLRNPTHVAVALRYDSGRMAAPRVVAKGERLLALRMIEVATEHGVPVVENAPLARTLFKAVAIGRDIPQDLYRAVAEVLAYVYALRGGRA
jgi:flagellar biosynthesis protein FlhB